MPTSAIPAYVEIGLQGKRIGKKDMHCSVSGSGALLLEGLAGVRSIISQKQLGGARFVEAFLRLRENGWRAQGAILGGLPDAAFGRDQAVVGRPATG